MDVGINRCDINGSQLWIIASPTSAPAYKCELLEIVFLDEAHHESDNTAAVQAEGDETMVRQERLQKFLDKRKRRRLGIIDFLKPIK